jgi:hypothetical protein
MSNKKALKELDKFLKENNNQVCLGLTHHIYGPLRGCNFKIKVDNVKQLTDYLDSYHKEVSEATPTKMIAQVESLKSGRTPKTLTELCTKTWIETGMQVTMQILPPDVYKNAENPPSVVKSFEEGQKEILMQLAIGKAMKDPFFFRMGII